MFFTGSCDSAVYIYRAGYTADNNATLDLHAFQQGLLVGISSFEPRQCVPLSFSLSLSCFGSDLRTPPPPAHTHTLHRGLQSWSSHYMFPLRAHQRAYVFCFSVEMMLILTSEVTWCQAVSLKHTPKLYALQLECEMSLRRYCSIGKKYFYFLKE